MEIPCEEAGTLSIWVSWVVGRWLQVSTLVPSQPPRALPSLASAAVLFLALNHVSEMTPVPSLLPGSCPRASLDREITL